MRIILVVAVLIIGYFFVCSKELVAEIAVVKEINENSIVIVNGSGKTTEVFVQAGEEFELAQDGEYFFQYEVSKCKRPTLMKVEE